MYDTFPSLLILNTLTAHIALLDAEGMIVAVNDAWTNFAQANSASSLAATGVGVNYLAVCRAAISAENPEAAEVAAGIADVLAGRRDSFALEYPCHSPHEQRWFLLRVTPLREDNGAIVAHEALTLRTKVGATERDSQHLFATLFHASPTAMVLSRLSDGRFLQVNTSFLTLTGYTRDEVIGRTSAELGLVIDTRWREETLAALHQGRTLSGIEATIVRKSGELCTGLVSVGGISMPRGSEADGWFPGSPPVATEWSVEARAGGVCVVRVVQSLFASTDD